MGAKLRVRRDEAGNVLAVSFEGEHDITIMDTNGNLVAPVLANVTGNITGQLTAGATTPRRAVYLLDPGLPGDCTINYPSGKAAIALGATACVITNSLVTTATMCFIAPLANDATLLTWKAVCTSNTITVTGGAAAAADWPFYFEIVQQVAP